MRYKVHAETDSAYERIARMLDQSDAVHVFVTSPRRRMLATGDLPPAFQQKIREQGGRISRDHQYDLESTP